MEYAEVYEAMNEYYRLKSSYENRIKDAKSKIKAPKEIKDKRTGETTIIQKSIEEKRRELQQLKPNCIYCNKPVGTIFINSNRKLIAKCGANNDSVTSKIKPCTLNIDIDRGKMQNMHDLYYGFLEDKQDSEKTIIKLKMDLLFKYLTEEETLEKFEENLEEYQDAVDKIIYIAQEISNKSDKLDKKPQIILAEQQIKDDIETIKVALNEYKTTNDPQFITDSLNNYIHSLVPKLSELRELKHDYYNVEQNEHTNEFTLVRTNTSVSSLEYVLEESEPKINSFVQ